MREEGRSVEKKGTRVGGRAGTGERKGARVSQRHLGDGLEGGARGLRGGGGEGTLATGSGTVTTQTSSTNESQDASNSTAASMTHTLGFRV
jgi:hypothetical protein